MTQHQIIARLISRKKGATPFELQLAAGSTSVHKRVSELKRKGWHIVRTPVDGARHGTYYGTAPVGQDAVRR